MNISFIFFFTLDLYMSEEADGSFNRPYVIFVKYIVIWYIDKTVITLGSLILLIYPNQ